MFNQRLAPLSKKGTIRGSQIRWLLRDEFTTALVPPSVNGSAAEPGPGTRLVYTDTNSCLGISDGSLTEFTNGIGSGDPGLSYTGLTKQIGIGLFFAMRSTAISGTRYQIGWASVNNPGATGMLDYMTDYAGALGWKSNQMGLYDGPWASLLTSWFSIILRSTGAYYFFKSTSGLWKLGWATTTSTAATVYPFYDARTGIGNPLDSIRVPQYYWLPVPLLSDSFNRANGALGVTDGAGHLETSGLGSGGSGISWVHTGWAISANRAQPGTATIGPNLVTNGDFTNWTGGNPDNWTVSEALPDAEVSEVAPANLHGGGGNGACNLYSSSGALVNIAQTVSTVAGKIYKLQLDMTARASGSLNIGGFSYIFGNISGSYTGYAVSGGTSFSISRTSGVTDLTIDNVSIYEMDMTNLTALKDLGTSDVVWIATEVNWNQAVMGAMLCADAESNPTNYIAVLICNITGVTGRCHIIKCVNGTLSILSTYTFSVNTNQVLFIVKDGSSVGIYYGASWLGGVVTITDAEIINNTIHGMYASPSAAGNITQYDNIAIYPRGSRSEYNILNAFSQPDGSSTLIPFMDPFSAGSTLGSRWTGSTWTVSSGTAKNTPVTFGADKLNNGAMEGVYVAGVAPGWNNVSGTPSESADAHGGSKAQQFIQPGRIQQAVNTMSIGSWYRFSVWGKRTAGTAIDGAVLGMQDGSTDLYGPGIIDAAYTKKDYYFRAKAITVFPRPVTTNTGTGDTVIVDDATLNVMTPSELIATVETGVSDVSVSANITVPGLYTDSEIGLAGIVICVDDAANPQNYILAYVHPRIPRVVLCKIVGGTLTELAAYGFTYVAGAEIKLAKKNSVVALYYNGLQLGTNFLISEVGIINNTRHGMFSTNPANTIDNFMVTGAPFIFLDQFTGAFDPLWTDKSTWSISGNKAISTPITFTPRTVINGNFSSWTGDNPNNWNIVNEDAVNYITEDAGKLRIVSDNSKIVSATSQAVPGAVVGNWTRCSYDVFSASGTVGLGLSAGGSFSSGNYSATSANKTVYMSPRITAPPQFVVIKGTACDMTIDNVTLSELTLSELIKTIVTDRNNVAVSAELSFASVVSVGCSAGVVACINSESAPTSFLIGYAVWRSGIYAAYFDKCVNGVYTNLGSANITYSAGAALKLVKSGTSVSLYYNNVQVGTTQTVSDAEIISNTIHGMFSTYPDNTLDNFSIG